MTWGGAGCRGAERGTRRGGPWGRSRRLRGHPGHASLRVPTSPRGAGTSPARGAPQRSFCPVPPPLPPTAALCPGVPAQETAPCVVTVPPHGASAVPGAADSGTRGDGGARCRPALGPGAARCRWRGGHRRTARLRRRDGPAAPPPPSFLPRGAGPGAAARRSPVPGRARCGAAGGKCVTGARGSPRESHGGGGGAACGPVRSRGRWRAGGGGGRRAHSGATGRHCAARSGPVRRCAARFGDGRPRYRQHRSVPPERCPRRGYCGGAELRGRGAAPGPAPGVRWRRSAVPGGRGAAEQEKDRERSGTGGSRRRHRAPERADSGTGRCGAAGRAGWAPAPAAAEYRDAPTAAPGGAEHRYRATRCADSRTERHWAAAPGTGSADSGTAQCGAAVPGCADGAAEARRSRADPRTAARAQRHRQLRVRPGRHRGGPAAAPGAVGGGGAAPPPPSQPPPGTWPPPRRCHVRSLFSPQPRPAPAHWSRPLVTSPPPPLPVTSHAEAGTPRSARSLRRGGGAANGGGGGGATREGRGRGRPRAGGARGAAA